MSYQLGFGHNKYRAIKTKCRAGHKHDSAKEANRCNDLSLMVKAGVIKDLKQQPEFVLLDGFVWKGKKVREVKYRADFSYFDKERDIFVVEDTKGVKTPVYLLKKKLLLSHLNETKFEFLES